MCQNTRTSKSFGLSFIILLCLLKEVFYIFSLENHDLDKARSKLFMPDVHLICNQLHGYKGMTKQRATPVKYGSFHSV